ncbi:MAG TPA: DUF29 domain-containing protein [Lichenihabitans sp.]|jgi:hypothetical protein|nr:DUF29 domain-containing protein [Lichenihabitans sp.]
MTDARVRNAGLYQEDFFLWAKEQARLLRERRFDELDLDNLIDEVESVGTSERREIRDRMTVLVAHLLKWKCQPGRRTPSWQRTIRDQRAELAELFEDSPSLRSYPEQVCARIYEGARLRASEETGIDFTLFPEAPPFTLEQALDDGFLPKEPDLLDQS